MWSSSELGWVQSFWDPLCAWSHTDKKHLSGFAVGTNYTSNNYVVKCAWSIAYAVEVLIPSAVALRLTAVCICVWRFSVSTGNNKISYVCVLRYLILEFPFQSICNMTADSLGQFASVFYFSHLLAHVLVNFQVKQCIILSHKGHKAFFFFFPLLIGDLLTKYFWHHKLEEDWIFSLPALLQLLTLVKFSSLYNFRELPIKR